MGVASSTADAPLLTIAGFDPSSGAGVTADLAVFAAHRRFGTAAITALTVQNTTGVFGVEPVPASLLRETLRRLDDDLPPAAIKIGMLAGAPQVEAVAEFLSRRPQVAVVLDPVVQSSSGRALLDEAGIAALKQQLLPLVTMVTPNTDELSVLTGLPTRTAEGVAAAAAALRDRYPGLSVVATGGHLDPPNDLLVHEGGAEWFGGERVQTTATHGTGCAFSSALTCGLAEGMALPDAVAAAKQYVWQAMRRAIPRGAGRGPLALLWTLY